jgi:hypothetical protein
LVALVLNPQTGHVSPQYHVVCDDQFTMVPFVEKNEVPPNWAQLVENLTEKVTEEHYELNKIWLFLDPELGDTLMPEQNPANHNKSDKTPSEQETFTHSDVSSSMLPTATQSPSCLDPPVLLHPEFCNKIISQTLYCILSYLPEKNLLRGNIFFQFLRSSIWRHWV